MKYELRNVSGLPEHLWGLFRVKDGQRIGNILLAMHNQYGSIPEIEAFITLATIDTRLQVENELE